MIRKGLVLVSSLAILYACGSDDGGGGATIDATDAGGSSSSGTPPGPPPPPSPTDGGGDGAAPLPEGLDPTFGTNGIARFGNQSVDWARSVLRQADGKIVVCGSQLAGNDLLLLRLDTTGKPDPTFGDAGRVQLDVPRGRLPAGGSGACALTPDGKILLAGADGDGYSSVSVRLYRFDGSGAIDATFGGGVTGLTVATGSVGVGGLAIRGDGTIDLAVQGYPSSYVTKLSAAGAVDTNFGTNGKTTLDASMTPTALAIAPSGKIVVAGLAYQSASVHKFVAQRMDANGTIDATFGTPAASFGGTATPSGLVVQPDEKVVLVGPDGNGGGAVVRITDQGALDTTFDADGIALVGGRATSVARASDGSFVVGTETGEGYHLSSTGAYLGSAPIGGWISAVLVQPDDKPVWAGHIGTASGTGMRIARSSLDGTPDATFGTNGALESYFGGADDVGADGLVQPDGKLLASLFTVGGGGITRWADDGTADSTFGLLGGAAVTSSTRNVALDAMGRIYAASYTGLKRYPSDGKFQDSWSPGSALSLGGVSGMFIHPNGFLFHGSNSVNGGGVSKLATDSSTATGVVVAPQTTTYTVAAQPDGKVLVGGGGVGTLLVARIDATTLALDTSFGALDAGVGTGVVEVPAPTGLDGVRGLSLQSDGKILATASPKDSLLVGGDPVKGAPKVVVARLDTSGHLDATFGSNGVASIDVGGDAVAYLARQRADGTILVVGWRARGAGMRDALVVRLTSSGALDTSFGTGGYRVFPIGNESGFRWFTLQPDGKALVVGYVNTGIGGDDLALFRFLP